MTDFLTHGIVLVVGVLLGYIARAVQTAPDPADVDALDMPAIYQPTRNGRLYGSAETGPTATKLPGLNQMRARHHARLTRIEREIEEARRG